MLGRDMAIIKVSRRLLRDKRVFVTYMRIYRVHVEN
jgi:hypothetical protein